MMDYFALFGLPPQLVVDKGELRKKYLELSRKYHPDYFATAGADAQQEALQATADLNKAFKTLSNREATIKYLLQQKGMLEEEEKYQLAPDFLMQMLDINEALADAVLEGDPAAKKQVQQELNAIADEIYEPVAAIVAAYQEGTTSKEELLQVKDYYFRKKYLERLQQQLGEKA